MAHGEATVALTADQSDLNSALKDSKSRLTTWGVAVGSFLGNVGAKAFSAILSGMKQIAMESVELAGIQARAEKKLEQALKQSGNAAGFSADQLKYMASQLQTVTNFGDEATIAAMAMLTTFQNIRGDTFVRTTKAAQDMAAFFDSDLTASAEMLGKALNDPVIGMTALTRRGITFTQTQKDAVAEMVAMNDVAGAQALILAELEGQIGGTAEAMANPVTQLANRWGDVEEEIGKVIKSVIADLMPTFEMLMQVIENMLPVFRMWATVLIDGVKGMLAAMQPFFQWLVETSVYAFSIVVSAFQNWRAVAQVVVDTVILSFVKMFEQLKYMLTVVIPEILRWFMDNWKEIFLDLANFQITLWKNMLENAKRFALALWDAVQGKGIKFEFKPLTDGFESALKELPQIAERQKSELEKSLEASIEGNVTNIVQDANQMYDKTMRGLKSLTESPELEPPDLTPDFEKVGAERVTQRKKTEKAERDQTGAFVALEALNRQIAQAAAGKSNEEKALDKQDEQIKLQRESNELQRQMLEEQSHELAAIAMMG